MLKKTLLSLLAIGACILSGSLHAYNTPDPLDIRISRQESCTDPQVCTYSNNKLISGTSVDCPKTLAALQETFKSTNLYNRWYECPK